MKRYSSMVTKPPKQEVIIVIALIMLLYHRKPPGQTVTESPMRAGTKFVLFDTESQELTQRPHLLSSGTIPHFGAHSPGLPIAQATSQAIPKPISPSFME